MLTEPEPGPARPFLAKHRIRVLAVLGTVFLLSALLPLVGGTEVRICPFYLLTHLPCPGCGMGRSFCAMTWGDPLEAFRYHLLGPLLYLYMGFLFVQNAIELKRRRSIAWPPAFARLGTALAIFATVAALLAWVLRLLSVWPLP